MDGPIDGKNVWSALSHDLPSPRREVLCHHDATVPYMAYISDKYKIVSGSTYKGLYDRWLSDPIDPLEQNLTFGDQYGEAILTSNAGHALLKYAIQNKEENDIGLNSVTISGDEVNEIRTQAQITCNGFTPPSNDSTEACHPITSPCLFDILSDPCETTNLASQLPDVLARLQSKLDYYGSIAKPTRNKPGDPKSNPENFNGTWTWWFDELNSTANSGDEMMNFP